MNGRVSHCFPLNGKSRDPYCQGIDGVVNAYYDSLAHGKVIKGAFNSYVDQVLPNFDHLPPPLEVDNCGHFTYFVSRDQSWTFY